LSNCTWFWKKHWFLCLEVSKLHPRPCDTNSINNRKVLRTGGMILTDENPSNKRATYSSATLSTTTQASTVYDQKLRMHVHTYITYKNAVCTSHRTVWTVLPACHIEVLNAYGNKGAWNLNTTKLLWFIITTPHSHLHLNWWLLNVYHTSNNAPILGPTPVTVLLARHPLWPSATWSDYTYTLFSLHGYYSWTVWPCRWFWNIMNYLSSDAAPCVRKLESS
jgi:hypothetical protein